MGRFPAVAHLGTSPLPSGGLWASSRGCGAAASSNDVGGEPQPGSAKLLDQTVHVQSIVIIFDLINASNSFHLHDSIAPILCLKSTQGSLNDNDSTADDSALLRA
ncbi:hypothetical protein CFAM422_010338 [Trichoderma lentiforme]|uniref:Uncharacterized protein n=1 Tax=Trichoderma lentiforme TaxID=1567552 RepID=A0A9P4X8G3_9HYPO|nr:hypothetical protein CFAM422_010338 [Trichoderma lentiforme]